MIPFRGGPHLMAHIGQKIPLGDIGRLCNFARPDQIRHIHEGFHNTCYPPIHIKNRTDILDDFNRFAVFFKNCTLHIYDGQALAFRKWFGVYLREGHR